MKKDENSRKFQKLNLIHLWNIIFQCDLSLVKGERFTQSEEKPENQCDLSFKKVTINLFQIQHAQDVCLLLINLPVTESNSMQNLLRLTVIHKCKIDELLSKH